MRRYLANFTLPLAIAALWPVVVESPWWTPVDYLAVYALGVFTMFLYDFRSWLIGRAVLKAKERKVLSRSGKQNSN